MAMRSGFSDSYGKKALPRMKASKKKKSTRMIKVKPPKSHKKRAKKGGY